MSPSAADLIRAELSKSRSATRTNRDADDTPTAENNAFAAAAENSGSSADHMPLNGPRVTNSIAAALSGPGTTVRVPRA